MRYITNCKSAFVHTFPLLFSALFAFTAQAHEGHGDHKHRQNGHSAPTYEVTPARAPPKEAKRLTLSILDDATGKPTAARFSLVVDGEIYVPDALSAGGLRFVSIHTAKKQRFTALYSRGAGEIQLALPKNARRGQVFAAKGYQYHLQTTKFTVTDGEAKATLRMRRWSDLHRQGWRAAEEHLHYERIDPKHDSDWLTIMAAENLSQAHFMTLKGGNLAGVWAQQFAYGPKGRGKSRLRTIIPGEEYRDPRQGHINLLGLGELIQPISTGSLGKPPVPYNYPPLHDIFLQSRRSGGIGGPAHGGSLAKNSTAVVDTVLGAAEFFEIANTHLYKLDVWYRLMNCGYILPPAAGTDLPNFPFREPWQPLLGETRMYVRTGEAADFETWKQTLRRGETFISSGPMIQLSANKATPGQSVRLAKRGDTLHLDALLESPLQLQEFEIVQNGQPLKLPIKKTFDHRVNRWRIHVDLPIDKSCWIAARGVGPLKQQLLAHTNIRQNATAHTAAIRIIVADQPISSSTDADFLIRQLVASQEAYRDSGRFEKAEHREHMLGLFERAIEKLQQQIK